jgi:hypothetical protein
MYRSPIKRGETWHKNFRECAEYFQGSVQEWFSKEDRYTITLTPLFSESFMENSVPVNL